MNSIPELFQSLVLGADHAVLEIFSNVVVNVLLSHFKIPTARYQLYCTATFLWA